MHKNLIQNYYKKKGHIKADYYKLKNNQQNGDNQGQKKADKSARANFTGRDYDDSDHVLSMTVEAKLKDDWIMNSACFYHICANKDWFFTYQPI